MKADMIRLGSSPLAADRAASLYIQNRAPGWAEQMQSGRVGPYSDFVKQQGPSLVKNSLNDVRLWETKVADERRQLLESMSAEDISRLMQGNAAEVAKVLVESGADTAASVPEVVVETSPVDFTPSVDQFTSSESVSDVEPRKSRLDQALKEHGLEPLGKKEQKQEDSNSWGAALAVMGAAQQVIGNFYAIKSQQSQLKQQALSLEFQGRMSQINARNAERQAGDILAAGRQQAMELTLRAGQVREGARATMGARGIRAGVGSGAETLASIDLMKEIDRFTIDANAVRAANAARMQGVNAANEGLLAGVSASNLRSQAGALNPVAGAMPSLLTGAGQYLSQRASDRRWAAWAASQGLGE